MKNIKLFDLLELLELSQCNGVFQKIVLERVTSLCLIKNCTAADLTIREVLSCVEYEDEAAYAGLRGECAARERT